MNYKEHKTLILSIVAVVTVLVLIALAIRPRTVVRDLSTYDETVLQCVPITIER